MHNAITMDSIYFRNTRSGKKGNRQPKPKQFKFNIPAIGPYAVDPTPCSMEVLSSIASAAVGESITLDPRLRETMVMGSWHGSGMSCVAFTKVPELVTCMVSIRGCTMGAVEAAIFNVCSMYPGVNAPSVTEHVKQHHAGGRSIRNTVIQVSGRLAPHVVDAVKAISSESVKCDVTFCNATQAKLCFAVTLPTGTYSRTLSAGSLHLLASSFPSWSGCISQPTAPYYKILCEPPTGCFRTSANKNSCCMLYADGRMRFQGSVPDCSRTAAALREALDTVMMGSYCKAFLSHLTEHVLEDEEAGEAVAPASEMTSMPASSLC